MMDLFAKRASVGDKVVLTLMNGNVLEGEITGFGVDYIALITKRSTAAAHHKMVAAWEILLDSSPARSEEKEKITYFELEPGTAPGEESIEYIQIEDTEIPESEGNEEYGKEENEEAGEKNSVESSQEGYVVNSKKDSQESYVVNNPEDNEEDSVVNNPEDNEKDSEVNNPEDNEKDSEVNNPEDNGKGNEVNNPEDNEDYAVIQARTEELLVDFNAKVASARLALYEPDLSFPLNSLDSDNPQEDKKQWDKIINHYQNCIKNRIYSPLSSLASELLKFAETYPGMGVFHYNAGCFLAHIENFERALEYFEEAFTREPSPFYVYNAASAALKILDYEKAHTNLAAYFNLVGPTDDPDAWYTFCGLTENKPNISVFRDVLLYLQKGNMTEEGRDCSHESSLLLLKSALYVLQKNKKYRDAEPLVTFLGEVEAGNEAVEREKTEALIDSSLSRFSGDSPEEYRNLLGILKVYMKARGDKKLNTVRIHNVHIMHSVHNVQKRDAFVSTANVNAVNSGTHEEREGKEEKEKKEEEKEKKEEEKEKKEKEKLSPYRNEQQGISEAWEAFYSKIPRRHGYIFKYIAPHGYGFIRDEEGRTYFFHLSSIIDSSISSMELGNVYWGTEVHVIFQPARGEQGDIAVQISAYQALDEMQKVAERYAGGRDYNKAIELIEYVLSIDSGYPVPKAFENWKEKRNEALEKEQALDERTGAEPRNREAWDSKASFLIEQERYEEALPALGKVIELTPDIINSLPSGRHISSFTALYDSNPEYSKALYKKSFVLNKLGRDREALEVIREVLELEPEHEEALIIKASSLLKLERPQEAHELIDRLLEKAPQNPEVLFLKGKALLTFHEYEEGLRHLEKALPQAPKDPDILLKYGYALSKVERFDQAVKAYDKAINLQPENSRAISNKGFILIMDGEYEKALDLYNGLIQLNPLNANLWSKKGAILTKMNRAEDALRSVDRALEIAPKNAEALFTKGYIYSKTGRDEEALRYFDRVLELTPFDQKALAKRAFVLSKLGRHAEAFGSIEEALDLSRYNPRTWYYKGFIHYNLAEYDDALFAFNRSAELNPADYRIERMKQFTLARLGRYEGEMETAAGELLVEEELFDRELQEEYDLAFAN